MERTEHAVHYMILSDSIIVNWNKRTQAVNVNNEHYDQVLAAIREDDLQRIPNLLFPDVIIEERVPMDEFVVHRGVVYSYGEPVHGYIGTKLLMFAKGDLPIKPLLRFWQRIKHNPSNNSKEQLYKFLEKAKCPLTEDGLFVAYKSVKKNMTDHHTGEIKYEIGKPVEMERSAVVDDASQSCGPGLHVGSFLYANSFNSSGLLLEVLVDPADVVSVPSDSSCGKLRACKVTPMAICNAGEYDTETIITVSEEPDDQPSLDEQLEDHVLLFKNVEYDMKRISSSFADGMINKGVEVQRVKPSKAPKAVREYFGDDIVKVYKLFIKKQHEHPCFIIEAESHPASCWYAFFALAYEKLVK